MTNAQSSEQGTLQSRHGGDTALGLPEYVMAAPLASRQSLFGRGPEDTNAPSNRMPQMGTSAPHVLTAATRTDPAAAAAEMADVEGRIRNSPMGRMIGSMAAKQACVQTGARFVKITD